MIHTSMVYGARLCQFVFAWSVLIMEVAVAAGTPAAGQHLTPEAARAQLEELRALSKDSTRRNLVNIYESVRRASESTSSALDFYLDAVMRVEFSGLTKENSKLREWREKHAGELDDRNYREALRLHLAYLALSLKRTADPEPASWLSDLQQFSSRVFDLDKNVRTVKPWMTQPIGSTVIAQAYGIDKLLPDASQWEMVVGNADGMIEKAVLPLLRKSKDPALIEYWDNRILRESKLVADVDRVFQKQVFEQTRLPELHWRRAQDLWVLGRGQEALQEMLKIMRAYPAHPSFKDWLDEAEKLLEELEAPGSPADAAFGSYPGIHQVT